MRYESNDKEQAWSIDKEKKTIYQKCIPYLTEKFREQFGEVEFRVHGLWFGSRGVIPPETSTILREIGLDLSSLPNLSETIILDSLGILHNHIYSG